MEGTHAHVHACATPYHDCLVIKDLWKKRRFDLRRLDCNNQSPRAYDATLVAWASRWTCRSMHQPDPPKSRLLRAKRAGAAKEPKTAQKLLPTGGRVWRTMPTTQGPEPRQRRLAEGRTNTGSAPVQSQLAEGRTNTGLAPVPKLSPVHALLTPFLAPGFSHRNIL